MASNWLLWDSNTKDRAAIQQLVDAKEMARLKACMTPRISFGTAGLRAKMAPGFRYMNDLVIRQTAQGLVAYIESACVSNTLSLEQVKAKGFCIGYDHRHNSHSFALITAAVFLSHGFKVFMFSQLVPTPLVPYSIKHKGCIAGVMVTASHNPKQDNGYKVYWSNGCQIVSPLDAQIQASILANLEPWSGVDVKQVSIDHPLMVDPLTPMLQGYLKECTAKLSWTADANASNVPLITYTAMHGVGADYVDHMFAAFGLQPVIHTPEQRQPDPEFPTVAFPNPEEGKGALALAIQTAEAKGSPLIFANDPDADRLALAEQRPDGSWHVFNGNQIGTMFAEWVWMQWRKRNPNTSSSSVCMLSTAVSSQMIKAMATVHGFHFEQTLTGFKWLGNKAIDLIGDGYTVLLAYEEAIGFMIGDICFDKDGVRAAAVCAEMANYVYGECKCSLYTYLDGLYDRYGYHKVETNYIRLEDNTLMPRVFNALRCMEDDGKHPLGKYVRTCGEYTVARVRDQDKGYDSGEDNKLTRLPVTPGAHMITFTFTNGCVATLRGSGTEPKLKYYVEVVGTPGQDREQITALHTAVKESIVQNWINPHL